MAILYWWPSKTFSKFNYIFCQVLRYPNMEIATFIPIWYNVCMHVCRWCYVGNIIQQMGIKKGCFLPLDWNITTYARDISSLHQGNTNNFSRKHKHRKEFNFCLVIKLLIVSCDSRSWGNGGCLKSWHVCTVSLVFVDLWWLMTDVWCWYWCWYQE